MAKMEVTTEKCIEPAGLDTLESLYDKYYERIYAYCVHRLFCRAVAEDVTSQVFLSVAERFDRFNGQTEQEFSSWIFAIAVNQCNSYLRKTLRRRKIFEKFQTDTANRHQAELSETGSDWPQVYAAIARLKEVEQTIITLRFFEELSYEQIATIINKREVSVRVILHRGLKKLRQTLNADFGDVI
ncbi:MAG: RNA polymerase sigma factor [Planctomycetota bacterium]